MRIDLVERCTAHVERSKALASSLSVLLALGTLVTRSVMCRNQRMSLDL